MRSTLVAAAVLALAGGTAHADDFTVIGGISSTTLHAPDNTGELQTIATGGGATVTMLCACDEATFGWELNTLFLLGEDQARVYDLGLSGIASFGVEGKHAVPFITFGLDMSAVSLPVEGSDEKERGVSMGLHGGAGLHGFLGDKVYWRGTVGFLGAGANGLTTQLMVGWMFGSD